MNRLVKYVHLPAAEKKLFLKAFFLLITYWLKLKISPTALVLAEAYPQSCADISFQSNPIPFERIVKILTYISRFTPSTCLSKALAGQVLMAKNGYKTEFHIGVAKAKDLPFEAHSWLTLKGGIILGDLEDIDRFRELPLDQIKDVL